MLNKEDFIKFILADPKGRSAPSTKATGKKAKPEADALGGYGFDEEISTPPSSSFAETTFARQLLEASGFGPAQYLATEEVILGASPAAQHLPDKVYYWPKMASRPYQTLLFELTKSSGELLKSPLFKSAHGVLEDALSRLVQDTLTGFEIGGEKRKADVKQGKQMETLCIVSIRDERNKEASSVNLVCFGTVARGEGSLETFHIREEARFWEPKLAEDHLLRLYDRHFKKLATDKWQDAFITGDERKLARKLMEVSQGRKADESKIQEAVVDLLEEIALSYGLRKKPGGRRLEATDLPQDHDIGIKDGALSKGAINPFRGMTLRDEKNRLLGYIIYCLDQKEDAEVLRAHLEKNNRFHNVLVVYPNGDSTGLELWQGNKPLQGKLTKRGAKFEGEGQVVNLLSRFFVVSKALVSNPAELAAELAYRARYLRGFALRELEKPELLRDKDLSKLYNSFHDIFLKGEEKGKNKAEVEAKKHDEFADSYAQTLTYGLLSARWISKDELAGKVERFTLDNAAGLLERTSPFFKELFTQVISQSHDASRDWLLQDITDLLDRIDIDAVFAGVQDDVLLGHDPVMHFYEPFLAAYDAQIKRDRGVFYTPHPVVSYIVRSVHELLQTEFDLVDGLADTATWGEMIKKHPHLKLPLNTDEKGNNKPISPDEPFVLILDPATGTATFLVEVIDVIYRTLVSKWKKQNFTEAKINATWNEYVPKNLLPRLYGFEVMMAPYAIGHLKIGIKLAETGYHFVSKQRANVYLTNSLEPAYDFSGRLAFDAPALAHEAASVNAIKMHKRFTVVIGNPPYTVMSANLSDDARSLIDPYRFVDGERLKEKSMLRLEMHLQDDYIKFFRIGQTVIDTTGCGVFGYVSNHSFLDNPTLRGMRQSLQNTFSGLWFYDLHGNSKKKDDAPKETKDKNVFDIQQGVAITLAKRLTSNGSQHVVRHADLLGPRDSKYRQLDMDHVGATKWTILKPSSPSHLFVPQDTYIRAEFSEFVSLLEIMPLNSCGIVSGREGLTYDFDKLALEERIALYCDPKHSDEWVREKFEIRDAGGYELVKRRRMVVGKKAASFTRPIEIKPFDTRWVAYTRGVLTSDQSNVMSHMLGTPNIGLITTRQTKEAWGVFATRNPIAHKTVSAYDVSSLFPLHIQPDNDSLNPGAASEPNLSAIFLRALAASLGVEQGEPHGLPSRLTPEGIFHYAYAVFHSPGYRTRYSQFLKAEFPRLPLTDSLDLLRALSKLGSELTALHLLESKGLNKPRSHFLGRNRVVSKVDWVPDNGGTVWIDCKGTGQNLKPGTSGFAPVPEEVWNFHIGGYQVCHKWLKDRKGRTLTDEDIAHYHKIVIALSETIRLMAEIDKVIDKHGGWPGAFQTGAKDTSLAKTTK